ncbi:hypothetical protein C0993_009396 [Termitomyces sp. T159_Od127]|nr:hypothetical protein C0993_009396 [Termitomyces sp. T159_Od127]
MIKITRPNKVAFPPPTATSYMPSLTISCASKPPPVARGLPITVEYTATTTVADVKGHIAAKFPNFYVARQKLSLKIDKANLDDEKRIVDLVGEKGGELQVKDLGRQISWRTVFLIEYAGPLIIHPLIYHFPQLWYGRNVSHSQLQKDLDGRLFHYQFAELSNLCTHLTLRSLRPPNSRVRAIPYGYGFSLISCPNYFFETLGWTVVTVMTGSIAAAVFLAVSTTQMALWAIKKHKNYKKEFGKEYPRGRYAMIPFIL